MKLNENNLNCVYTNLSKLPRDKRAKIRDMFTAQFEIEPPTFYQKRRERRFKNIELKFLEKAIKKMNAETQKEAANTI